MGTNTARQLRLLGAALLTVVLTATLVWPTSAGAEPRATPQAAGQSPAHQRCARPADITAQLRRLPHVTFVGALDPPVKCARAYLVGITQPANHAKPRGPKFRQSLQLIHRGTARPMVVATGGYTLSLQEREVTRMLGANQIAFEHRFFGTSRPKSPNWRTQLTIKQSARDQHRIITSFKKMYRKAWLSTGDSKGGMTVTYHRRFFPNDVDGTIAYVAPNDVNDAEDSAYTTFLNTVGTQACREKLLAIQRRLLGVGRAELTTVLKRHGSYRRVGGVDVALEQFAVDLPFQVWQYEAGCSAVPAAAATGRRWTDWLELWTTLMANTDGTLSEFQAYSFQAVTELGSPTPNLAPVADLLRHADKITMRQLLPPKLRTAAHNGAAIRSVDRFVRTKAHRILFIYGEYDPWSAEPFSCGTTRAKARQCRVMTVPQGPHGSAIQHLPTAQRKAATRLVKAWARR